MPFTYNITENLEKNPANFSSIDMRNFVTDAMPLRDNAG